MNSILLAVAVIVGAVQPVPFESRGYDEVILNSGETLRGTIHSARGASTMRIQLLSQAGVRAFPRNLVRDVRSKQTLAEAHDAVAKDIGDKDADQWHGLALTCLNKRPPLLEKAEADLLKAIAARPANGPARVLLATVLAKGRRYAEARTVAEEALQFSRGDAEAHIAHGKILMALGEDARDALARALAIRESQEAHLAMAQAELAMGRYTEAEAAVVKASRLAQSTPELKTVHGDILLAGGELDRAAKLYADAARTGGYGVDAARRGLAAVMYLRGQYKEADEILIQADQSDPYVNYMQGLTKLARGSDYYSEATKQLTAAASGNVGRADIALGTFLYHDLGGDMAAASPKFRKAAKTNPQDPYAQLMSAWCSFKLGKYSDAATQGAEAAKLAPLSPEAHAASGASALMSGSHAEAVRRYRLGLEKCPESGMLLAGLGTAQLTGGDRLAAEESYSKALVAGYRGPDVFMGQGYLSFLKEEYLQAAAQFTSAVCASGESDSGSRDYATDAISKLYAGKGLRAQIETFDHDEIVEPLRIREARGVSIAARDGKLVISGTLEKDPRGRLGLDVPVDGGLFKSFSADVILDPSGDLTAGIALESKNGGVQVARVPSMGAAFRTRDGRDKAWSQWRVLTPWRGDGKMRLSIEIVEASKDLARIEVRASTPTPASPLEVARAPAEFKASIWRERALAAGIFVSASADQEIEARADNMVVVEKQSASAQ